MALSTGYGLVGGVSASHRAQLLGGLVTTTVVITFATSIHFGLQATASVTRGSTFATSVHVGFQGIGGPSGFRRIPVLPAPLVKPTIGRGINWGHPLAQRLRLCCLLNEGAGVGPRDLVDNLAGIASSSFQWAADAYGMKASSANNSHVQSVDFGTNPRYDYSVISAACLMSFEASAFSPLVGASRNFTGGVNYDWYLGGGNPNLWTVQINTAAGAKILQFANTSTPATVLLAMTYDGVTLTMYINGVPVATSVINSAVVLTAGALTSMGAANLNQSAHDYYCAYMWDRVLTAAEMAALAVNPYSAFLIPDRRWEATSPKKRGSCQGLSWPTASTTPAPQPPSCLGVSWPIGRSQNGGQCIGVSWPTAESTGRTSAACIGVSWPTAESDAITGQQVTCVTPGSPNPFPSGAAGPVIF